MWIIKPKEKVWDYKLLGSKFPYTVDRSLWINFTYVNLCESFISSTFKTDLNYVILLKYLPDITIYESGVLLTIRKVLTRSF